MSIYTVHEPPPPAAGLPADPQRFVFVRDGFSFWAFLLAPLWMLWHRLWLVLAIYAVVWFGIEAGLLALGVYKPGLTLVALLIAVLVGLEAGTLRRFALGRRGWRNVGIVSGDDLEDAERRFFDPWLRQPTSSQAGMPSAPAAALPGTPAAPVPRMPQAPDVIGLFPQPGAQR